MEQVFGVFPNAGAAARGHPWVAVSAGAFFGTMHDRAMRTQAGNRESRPGEVLRFNPEPWKARLEESSRAPGEFVQQRGNRDGCVCSSAGTGGRDRAFLAEDVVRVQAVVHPLPRQWLENRNRICGMSRVSAVD